MGFCGWADVNERNRIYHDTEWGIPVHDDMMDLRDSVAHIICR